MEKKTLYPDIIKRIQGIFSFGIMDLFKPRKDGAFTTGLIATGLIGCFSVLYLQASQVGMPEQTLVLTSGIPEPQAIQVSAKLPMIPELEKPNYMEIIGTRKAGSELEFKIDAYHPAADYFVDFGDGNMALAKKQSLTHTYKHSGVYSISMEVNYRGEKKKLPIEQLWIEK